MKSMMATLMRSFAFMVLTFVILVGAYNVGKWNTLHGDPPVVIARGGFSGLFPDSSSKAYEWAQQFSLPNLVQWCDVQLTKDAIGICFPDLRLNTASNIEFLYENERRSYKVNAVATEGWFAADYTFVELSNVSLLQRVGSRPGIFDYNRFPILTVLDVANLSSPNGLWLNVQHDSFYTLDKALNMSRAVLSLLTSTKAAYISSPELKFLQSIQPWKPQSTKLIYSFNGDTILDYSTNISYENLLQHLSALKKFVDGIIVPKQLIYPTSEDQYIHHSSYLVVDAHRIGLEVYAYSFSNDVPYAFNFGYDPVKEYLQFIDNGLFSVDGVVSDFPITPSATIACYTNLSKDMSAQAKPLVISSKGSSGYYAGCTDAAYLRAISDGADILDCPVQMTKDGIAVCLGSISLFNDTYAAKSNYSRLAENIPELGYGVFSFSLTWREIQNLTPSLTNLCLDVGCLPRNPRFDQIGSYLTLTEFLVIANNSAAGLLISIENSVYLSEKKNLHVADSVFASLRNANLVDKRIMIQSTDKTVLLKFKKEGYEIVYKSNAVRYEANFLSDIGKFANSVVINKDSIYLHKEMYLLNKTDMVEKLHEANLSVYVELFRNEFITQKFDFMFDPYVEINTFMASLVDGVITEYPETAAKYKRNKCLGLADKTPSYMLPILPGRLLQLQVRDKLEKSQPTHKESNLRLFGKLMAVAFVTVAVISFLSYLTWNALQIIQWFFQIDLVPVGNPVGLILEWIMRTPQ